MLKTQISLVIFLCSISNVSLSKKKGGEGIAILYFCLREGSLASFGDSRGHLNVVFLLNTCILVQPTLARFII